MTVIEKIAEGKVYVSGIAEVRRATLREMLETYREHCEKNDVLR
jgi:hypothetical protein